MEEEEKILFDGAFEMYATHGLSLSEQHDILVTIHPKIRLNLFKFATDAAEQGWSTKKIIATIKDYCKENDIKINFIEKEPTNE